MKITNHAARTLLVAVAALSFACASGEKTPTNDLLRNRRPYARSRPQPASEAVSGQAPHGPVEGGGGSVTSHRERISADTAGYCLECSRQKELCQRLFSAQCGATCRTLADGTPIEDPKQVGKACSECQSACGPNLFKQ